MTGLGPLLLVASLFTVMLLTIALLDKWKPAKAFPNVLQGKRWLLQRPENLSKKQTSSFGALLKLNLASIWLSAQ